MNTFYLVRHGRTEWNARFMVMGRNDVPLDLVGQKQAGVMSSVFRGLLLDGVYASPQKRAQQTAKYISKVLNLPVITSDALAEVDYPAWEGKTYIELRSDPAFAAYQKQPVLKNDPVYESAQSVQERVCRFAKSLVDARSSGRYALVSHADPIRAFLSFALRQPLEEFHRFRVANASVTVLEEDQGRWTLALFNYVSHVDLNTL